jgi:streptogramin lyase
VHGAAKVNESIFYVSAWGSKSVASYSYENGNWTYQLVVDNQLTSEGSHIAVDECGRIWFVDTQFGLRIFNSSGTSIGNWSMNLNSNSLIYDVLLLPNYVVLVSLVHQRRVVKYDPQVICS